MYFSPCVDSCQLSLVGLSSFIVSLAIVTFLSSGGRVAGSTMGAVVIACSVLRSGSKAGSGGAWANELFSVLELSSVLVAVSSLLEVSPASSAAEQEAAIRSTKSSSNAAFKTRKLWFIHFLLSYFYSQARDR